MKYIPSLLTCVNLFIGCIGIFYVLTDRDLEAIYFVFLAGLFDFLDGFAARLLKAQSEFGKQLDSLSDMVSFGVLPAFFMVQLLQDTPWYPAAFGIAIFSAIRLAIFNIDDSQKDSFKGLATPANAIMITSLTFLPFQLKEYTLVSICAFSCMMLVSPVRLIALKFKNTNWKGNEGRWLLILGVIVLSIVFQWTFLPFLIPFYLVVSLVSNVIFKEK